MLGYTWQKAGELLWCQKCHLHHQRSDLPIPVFMIFKKLSESQFINDVTFFFLCIYVPCFLNSDTFLYNGFLYIYMDIHPPFFDLDFLGLLIQEKKEDFCVFDLTPKRNDFKGIIDLLEDNFPFCC